MLFQGLSPFPKEYSNYETESRDRFRGVKKLERGGGEVSARGAAAVLPVAAGTTGKWQEKSSCDRPWKKYKGFPMFTQ
jgi:hypothetical protein